MSGKSQQRISPVAIDALKDALSKVVWYRGDIRAFLASALSDYPELLAGVDFENNYKAATVAEVVDRMLRNPRYQEPLIQLMVDVASMDEFPRLRRAEDAKLKIAEAGAAVARLRKYVKPYEEVLVERQNNRDRIERLQASVERQRSVAAQLEKLRDRFVALHASANPHARGIEFEALLRDLFSLFDLDPKAAFRIEGEQIDGAFTLDNMHFLLEARWRKEPAERADLDAFDAKIRSKIENTLGLFISMEGFMDTAVSLHSGKGAVMILLDGGDLFAVLDGRIALPELMRRKLRYAAQTGGIYLSASELISAE